MPWRCGPWPRWLLAAGVPLEASVQLALAVLLAFYGLVSVGLGFPLVPILLQLGSSLPSAACVSLPPFPPPRICTCWAGSWPPPLLVLCEFRPVLCSGRLNLLRCLTGVAPYIISGLPHVRGFLSHASIILRGNRTLVSHTAYVPPHMVVLCATSLSIEHPSSLSAVVGVYMRCGTSGLVRRGVRRRWKVPRWKVLPH